MLGMNSHGIGNVSNSVHSNDNRVGVPNAFVRRASLEGAIARGGRERGLLAARARGTNHFLADTRGRLWDIETSATASAFMDHSSAGFMAHTNHYVAAEMAPFEAAVYEESSVRLTTAKGSSRRASPAATTPSSSWLARSAVTTRLRTQAICGHPDHNEPLAEQGMTVGSMICDLDERRIYVCAGPPCENPYQMYEM